jgi:hypothetical protein
MFFFATTYAMRLLGSRSMPAMDFGDFSTVRQAQNADLRLEPCVRPPSGSQGLERRLLDVSMETVRFLLWHEYLHIYLKQLHTEEFRRHERMWPDHAACNRDLDALNERSGVPYW